MKKTVLGPIAVIGCGLLLMPLLVDTDPHVPPITAASDAPLPFQHIAANLAAGR